MKAYEMEELNASCIYNAINCARAFMVFSDEQRHDILGQCISDSARDYVEIATYEAYGEVDQNLTNNILNIIGSMVEMNPNISDASIVDTLNKCGICLVGQRYQWGKR